MRTAVEFKGNLTVISNLPKDSVQKAVGIVALLRKEGLNNRRPLSVLGSVKRTAEVSGRRGLGEGCSGNSSSGYFLLRHPYRRRVKSSD